MKKEQWFLIENETGYKKAIHRYEQIRNVKGRTSKYKEKMLLVHLINQYENSKWPQIDMNPIEIIKIRVEEFGYKSVNLTKDMKIKSKFIPD